MLLLIDNYDSFTWNLVHYLMELGAEVEVVRNDDISAGQAMSSGAQPCAAASRSRTVCACASANGEPRVPIRNRCAAEADCAIKPRNANPGHCQ